MDPDRSIEKSIDKLSYQMEIATCLQRSHNMVEARQVLLKLTHAIYNAETLQLLAVVEEKLGLHSFAVQHIRQAYRADNRMWEPNPAWRSGYLGDQLDKDYARINAQQNAVALK